MESRKFDLLSPDQVFYTDSVVHREYRFTDSSFLNRQCCSLRIQIYIFIISKQIVLFTEDIDLQIHHFYTDSVVRRGYRFIDLEYLYSQCCSQRIQIYRFIISIQIVLFTEDIDLQIQNIYTDSVVHREYRFIDSSFLYRQCCSQRIQIYRFIIFLQIVLFTEDIDLQIDNFYTNSVVHRGYRFIDSSFLYRQRFSQRIQIYRYIIFIQIVLVTENIELQIHNFYTDSVVHRGYRFIDSSFLYRQHFSQRIQIYRFIISIQIVLFTEDIDLQIYHFYTDSVVHREYRFIDS